MNREMSLRTLNGGYRPGTTYLHHLDARTKLAVALMLIVTVVCADRWFDWVAMMLILAGLLRLCRLRPDRVLRAQSNLATFCGVIFLMNFLFFAPHDALVSWWIFHPSLPGAVQGAIVILRLLVAVLVSGLLTVTTKPQELTRALIELMAPLRTLRLPSERIALILSVAIQFIPTLMVEADLIRMAQIARGADFQGNNLFERARAVFPLVIPIFIAAFRRAEDLAIAMETRGYDPDCAHVRRRRSVALPRNERLILLITVALMIVIAVS